MDIAMQIPAKCIKEIESLQPAELSNDELRLVVDYINLTRDAQETKQLFDIFYFNLLCLRNNFVFYAGDTVDRLPSCPKYNSENIAVNAFVINLISAAKTLVENLRAVATRWFEKDETNKDEFNKYVSNIYDTSIVYRILMNLRDFAQHGNLPVSHREGRYSFDISQILSTPHFNLNNQVEQDMNDFLSNFDLSENIACLALTITTADFVVNVIDIYQKFLRYIKECISSSYRKIQEMTQINPTIICSTHKEFKGYIVYLDGDDCHAFDLKENPNEMITDYEKYVIDIFNDEKTAFDEMRCAFK